MSSKTISERAAEWALTQLGCTYSQEKRTQANIFDCSSLVARAYGAQGKKWKYGGSVPRSNQEVYDDDFELIWPESYAEIGKKLGGAEVIQKATEPGDVQFLCTDSKTSRANRITHVAMVADAKRIVHARGKAYGVCTSPIAHYAGKICAIVRYNPNGTLRSGMKGFRTQLLQQKLNELGAALNADGDYGSATINAVRVFQTAKGLPITGKADIDTLLALKIVSAVEQPEQMAAHVVKVTGTTVHVRSGPGTTYDSVKIACKGEAFKAVDADGWQSILLDSQICWISKKYISLEKASDA